MSNTIVEFLVGSYQEAVKHLIPFTAKVRTPNNDLSGKYSVSSKELDRLFSEALWASKPAGGHRKLINRLTRVVVEYKNHDTKGGVDPGAVLTILDQVQKHLNILCNHVFCYSKKHWKTEPDYKVAAERLKKLFNKQPRKAP
jgi:hypothetical protein